MTASRGRGRPVGGGGDAKDAILAAARKQFAAKGFAGASLRAIAADAGVDASLIRHYFGDKSQLLVATLELPFNPLEKIESVLADGVDGLAERLLRTFLESWDPHRDVFAALVRTQLAGGSVQSPIVLLVRNVVAKKVAGALSGADVELRASLIASHILGLAMMRYVVGLEPLAAAEPDDVIRSYAPPMQRLMDAG